MPQYQEILELEALAEQLVMVVVAALEQPGSPPRCYSYPPALEELPGTRRRRRHL